MTSVRIGLGIDAGGTATRWCLVTQTGEVLARGDVAPLTGHVYAPEVRARSLATLETLVAGVGAADTPPTHVLAGITGLDAGTEAAAFYRNEIAHRVGVDPAAVIVENDMGVAYRAACAPGTGILVYSGTGSVACHMQADGALVRVGGRGVVIDDAGSGFWIAKEAVKALFRAEDLAPGSGWATALGRHLARGFGGATWDHARQTIYAGDRGAVARLAQPVAEAAGEGDATARAILAEAGRELALLARALLGRLGPREVVLAGGATRLHADLWTGFAAGLPPGIPYRRADLDGAAAAARTAAGLSPSFSPGFST